MASLLSIILAILRTLILFPLPVEFVDILERTELIMRVKRVGYTGCVTLRRVLEAYCYLSTGYTGCVRSAISQEQEVCFGFAVFQLSAPAFHWFIVYIAYIINTTRVRVSLHLYLCWMNFILGGLVNYFKTIEITGRLWQSLQRGVCRNECYGTHTNPHAIIRQKRLTVIYSFGQRYTKLLLSYVYFCLSVPLTSGFKQL